MSLSLRGVSVMAFALAVTTTVVLGAQNRGIQPDRDHPILAIGSAAPDFALPGVDGKIHRLSDYAAARILAVMFESNHCPTSQLYEGRIEKLYEDYRSKGVAFVAINPNNPGAIRLDELGYTDVTDSLAEMKIRAAYRHIRWPYLYDGETQAVSIKYGVVATPHIFIFDRARKLQYQGRIDDNQREDLVKSHDARDAIDALLAGRPVPTAQTGAFGCSTKWLSKATGVEEEAAKIKAAPVTLDLVGGDGLKNLRANSTGKVLLVHFWSLDCKACVSLFHDLETTYRMYRGRAFEFVTVSTNRPADKPTVLAFLQQQYASNANKLFDSDDAGSLQTAWGHKWRLGSPFTAVLAPGGEILYEKEGTLDIIDMRRVILANMPDTRAYIGQKAYWAEAVAAKRK